MSIINKYVSIIFEPPSYMTHNLVLHLTKTIYLQPNLWLSFTHTTEQSQSDFQVTTTSLDPAKTTATEVFPTGNRLNALQSGCPGCRNKYTYILKPECERRPPGHFLPGVKTPSAPSVKNNPTR